ncbi:MAG TPA: hypothetical protein VFV66_25810 [Nonomuraea sp.]|nr:hypothetical protein [Nonomuraea sp.]
MGAFEDLHRKRITGSLAMFDRMIFKGHLSALYKQDGARCFLWSQGVPLTNFTDYAKATTERIANNARKLATDAGRPVISFDHVKTRNRVQQKDDLAKSIAERDGITEGIVCLISAVEPCMSFQVRRRHETKRIELFRRERKCLHHYLYMIDPEFGFMHVRIQGWIPYECQIYINGREWLARALDKAKIGYVRYENSLLAIDDLEAAAKLCERFAHRAWPRVLNAFARMLNPLLGAIGAAGYGGYYWVLDQAEIATDVMFKTRPQLLEVWPDLVRHASLNMSSTDVLGFLGRKLHPSLKAQVVTDTKRRPEGWRVRHRMGGNWVKVYDKASVLRVETTINNPREFRVLRLVTNDAGRRERRWCEMRKGVGDLWRNFQVGIGANHRYLEALAAAPLKGEGVAALDALCRPRTNHGRTYARFSPLSPNDLALFRAALAGEHAIRGFRNADITARLYRRPPADREEAHRRCERVSRLIVKLRGHGLVAKIPRARRYRVTRYGHRVMTAAITLHDHDFAVRYMTAA